MIRIKIPQRNGSIKTIRIERLSLKRIVSTALITVKWPIDHPEGDVLTRDCQRILRALGDEDTPK